MTADDRRGRADKLANGLADVVIKAGLPDRIAVHGKRFSEIQCFSFEVPKVGHIQITNDAGKGFQLQFAFNKEFAAAINRAIKAAGHHSTTELEQYENVLRLLDAVGNDDALLGEPNTTGMTQKRTILSALTKLGFGRRLRDLKTVGEVRKKVLALQSEATKQAKD